MIALPSIFREYYNPNQTSRHCVVDTQAKIGAGMAQETVIAKPLETPVVIVIPISDSPLF